MVFWICISLLVSSGFLAVGDKVRVTLNVFSGSPDPVWEITGPRAATFLRESTHASFTLPTVEDTSFTRPIPSYKMGYRGFEVMFRTDVAEYQWMEEKVFQVYNMESLEYYLLETGRENLPDTVVLHVAEEIARVAGLGIKQNVVQNRTAVAAAAVANNAHNGPIVSVGYPIGPDNETVYDPKTDCEGYFVTHQSKNNCYDYGNDIATNTFAQPGRGSGQKWKENTCDDMRAGAERDGLKWAGTTLPTEDPATGHYVALLIWPRTNFHWIRRDTQPKNYWSHKPGGSPVKNVDDNNKKITDPSKSDFSPWTQFCGYMITVPSKVTIN